MGILGPEGTRLPPKLEGRRRPWPLGQRRELIRWESPREGRGQSSGPRRLREVGYVFRTPAPPAYPSRSSRTTSLRLRPSLEARATTRRWTSPGTRTAILGACAVAVESSGGRPGRGFHDEISRSCSTLEAKRSRSASDKMRPPFVLTVLGIASPSRNRRRAPSAASWHE